jgi:hypothetical protein
MHEMQVDKASIPAHTIDLDNTKVLIRPEQAEGAIGKNVIIGEPRPKNVDDKILAREVTLEKTPHGKESLKITVKASRPGGARKFLARDESACNSARPVRHKADPKLSSLSARKWVRGRLTNQGCKEKLQNRNSHLTNY